jgi:GNAT superfamily N-acetyltransferase
MKQQQGSVLQAEMEKEIEIDVMIADESHEKYVDIILETIENAARVRGTGIAQRSHDYVAQKMKEGKAIIALAGEEFAGFSYIESWGSKQFVATSGLIVEEKFRNRGLAKRIKHAAFRLARRRWPEAKLFSLTSGSAVMKLNTELGYVPVTFADLTDDEAFWRGCNGCVNHDVLTRTGRRYCICTAMLFDPANPRCRTIEEQVFESEAFTVHGARCTVHERAGGSFVERNDA